MELELILGVKAGIGRNFAEAEAALKAAQNLKEIIEETDAPQTALGKIIAKYLSQDYAIVLYDKSLKISLSADSDNQELLSQVQQIIDCSKDIEETYGKNSKAYKVLQKIIENFSFDPATKALTPFGYLLNTSPLESLPSWAERFFILIDVNDMHYWNSQVGYEKVSRYLKIIGQTLVKSTRSRQDSLSPEIIQKRRFDTGLPDLVVSRLHGDASDEFLIDLYCKKTDVVKIAERLFDSIYREQKKLYQNCFTPPILSPLTTQ